MEESVKEQQKQPTPVAGKPKQRYPLRSATKPTATELPTVSASRRGSPAATVSKSVGVLDLSGKEKSAKPPRRLSIPANSAVSRPLQQPGTITPISETRVKRSTNGRGKSDTSVSIVTRTTTPSKKFDVLASTSYWLHQIKLFESADKHSISLGLFRLALEAGCEPLQQMRNALKSYTHRHELGESVKELFESYNISDKQEQLQVSESISQVPEEGIQSSDDEVHSSSSTVEVRKLTPRSLNAGTDEVLSVTESATKETTKKNSTATRSRGSLNRRIANLRSVGDIGSSKLQKKPKNSSNKVKGDAKEEKDKIGQKGKKSNIEEGAISPAVAVVTPEANKENMDAPQLYEVGPTEVM